MQNKIWNPLISINCKWVYHSENNHNKCKVNNWAEENTAEPLKDYKNRVKFTSISVRTKGAKQAGTIQLSKYVVYIQDVPKVYTTCI